MMFGLLLTYALARGVWHGLRGRTRVLRAYKKDGPRLQMTHSVFAYGDGIHDDAPNFQRIIDGQRGWIKHVPAGEFSIRKPIHIDGGTEVQGAGADETILWSKP